MNTETLPPSAAGLVSPSLITMAKRGFDVACLAHVQQAAFRLAAQTVQHRNASGKTTRVEDIKVLVEKTIAGKDFKAGSNEITPGHIATYLSSKALLQKVIPEQLLNEAWSLANTRLPEDAFGKEPQMITTNWLAQHLVALKQYASRLEKATPTFSRAIRENADKIEATYVDRIGLRQAMDVLYAVAAASEFSYDVDLDIDTHRPS